LETLKKMPWAGTVLTVVFLAVLLWRPALVDYTIAPVFLCIVISVYFGGLRWGLASATLALAAEIWLLWPLGQYYRLVLAAGTLYGVVWLIAELQYKARQLDSLNGNIVTLRKLAAQCSDLLDDFDRLSRQDIRAEIMIITKKVTNIATTVWGWHQLHHEIEEVKTLAEKEKGVHHDPA